MLGIVQLQDITSLSGGHVVLILDTKYVCTSKPVYFFTIQ